MKNKTPFWEKNNGKITIAQAGLLNFIEKQGYAKIKLSDEQYILGRIKNNRLRKTTIEDIASTIKLYLTKHKEYKVYEVFAKGIGSYINPGKFNLLKHIKLIDDRDEKDKGRFFFQNVFCEITNDEIKVLPYESLDFPIWENRIIGHDYNETDITKPGQFEIFCRHLAKDDKERFLCLKSFLGYLLHRNKDRGESRAIILYDENMGNDKANGGVGKTLLSEAISKCREVETFDGKGI